MVAQTWLEAASYPKADDAQAAVRDLESLGLSQQDISVLYTDTGHNVKAGILDGALWGGLFGGLLGLLFPPLGLLVAAGPIVGVLTSGLGLAAIGAITVGAVQGIVTALIQLGMPDDIATRFGEQVHKGDTLVVAHTPNAAMTEEAGRILATHHPRQENAPAANGVVSLTPAMSSR